MTLAKISLHCILNAAEFRCIAGLTAILRLLQREKIHFSLICSFYCCVVKKD